MLNAWHYKPNYGYSMLRDSKNHVREQIFQDRAHRKKSRDLTLVISRYASVIIILQLKGNRKKKWDPLTFLDHLKLSRSLKEAFSEKWTS